MFINDYTPEDYSQGSFFDVPDGIHEIKIVEAKVKTSKAGKQMIEVTYQCKTSPTVPYYDYYVEGENFNRNMTRFFDAFSIRPGDFQFQNWKGLKGAAQFAHRDETYTDKMGSQKTINKCYLKSLMIPEANQAAPTPQQYQQPRQAYPSAGGWN